MCTALSHAVIAVSRHTADHLVHVEHAPKHKVHVIPNGIDFERVKVSDSGAAARVRAELAPADTILLLTAGRLHPEKGYEHLFEALPSVVAGARQPWILAVAGAGPFEAEYRARVSDLGLTDHVRFLGFRRDLPDLMAAADVFVLASVAEAFGLVLAEALYLGAPVLATTAGAIPEIVDDGVSGLLVAPGDSRALAEALIKIIDDGGLRRRLAGAGRDKVLRQFDFREMIRRYEQVYERLLASPTARAHA
jgi:glycosyltransferase involved in cell wall biosynthesis